MMWLAMPCVLGCCHYNMAQIGKCESSYSFESKMNATISVKLNNQADTNQYCKTEQSYKKRKSPDPFANESEISPEQCTSEPPHKKAMLAKYEASGGRKDEIALPVQRAVFNGSQNLSLPPNTYMLGNGLFKCDVCPGTTFNGIAPLKDHANGQKHKKKLLQQHLLNVNSPLNHPEVQMPTSKEGAIKPTSQFLERPIHQKDLERQQQAAASSESPNQSLPADTYLENGIFKCRVCPGLSFNGIIPLQTHVGGEKHRKALSHRELLSGESHDCSLPPDTYLEGGLFKCRVCPDVAISGTIPLRAHVAGEKHRKALLHRELSSNEPRDCSLPPDTFLEGGLFKCRVCPDVFISGILPLRAHVEGNEHQKALFKQQGTITTGIPDVDQYFIGDNGSYKCKVCPDFEATGIVPVKAHLVCYKHQRALRKWLENGSNNISSLTSPTSEPVLTCNKDTPSCLTASETGCESMGVEEKILKAWKHQMPCHFSYEKIEIASYADKLVAASSHFACLGMNDVIPNLVRFL